MQPEQETESPQVKLKEHWVDLDWIIHNLIVFAPAAASGHREFGRGTLIVDTPIENETETCPFAYFPQEEIALYEDKEINQMITAYGSSMRRHYDWERPKRKQSSSVSPVTTGSIRRIKP